MKKCFFFLVAITVAILFSNCNEQNTAVEYGSISGIIYDGLTFQPINLAEISTSPATSSVVSSSIGVYKIEFITPGIYELQINRSGYKSKKVKIQIIANKTTIADVILEKGTGSSGNDDSTDTGGDSELTKYLFAWYKFDGNSNNSLNSKLNLESFNVNYVLDKNGNSNKAIEFAGDYYSFAISAETSDFNLNDFTYSCWLKPSSNYGTPYNDYIDFISRWGNWGAGNQSFAFSLGSSGKLKGILYTLTSEQIDHSSNYTFFNTSSQVKPNEWTHIAISVSKYSILNVYINGELAISQKTVIPQFSSMYGLCIGKRYDEAQQSFYDGAMDDLKIYNKSLTEEQIKSIFNSGL